MGLTASHTRGALDTIGIGLNRGGVGVVIVKVENVWWVGKANVTSVLLPLPHPHPIIPIVINRFDGLWRGGLKWLALLLLLLLLLVVVLLLLQ